MSTSPISVTTPTTPQASPLKDQGPTSPTHITSTNGTPISPSESPFMSPSMSPSKSSSVSPMKAAAPSLPHTPTPMPNSHSRTTLSQSSDRSSNCPSSNSSIPSLEPYFDEPADGSPLCTPTSRPSPKPLMTPATITRVISPGETVYNLSDNEVNELSSGAIPWQKTNHSDDIGEQYYTPRKDRGLSITSEISDNREEDKFGGDHEQLDQIDDDNDVSVWFTKRRLGDRPGINMNSVVTDVDDGEWMTRRVGGDWNANDSTSFAEPVSLVLPKRESRRLPRPKAFIVTRGKHHDHRDNRADKNNVEDRKGSTPTKSDQEVEGRSSVLGPRRSLWGSDVKTSGADVRTGRVEFVQEDVQTEYLRKCMSAMVISNSRTSISSAAALRGTPQVASASNARAMIPTTPNKIVLRSDDFVDFMKVAAETSRIHHRKRRMAPSVIFSKAHRLWRKVRSKRDRH